MPTLILCNNCSKEIIDEDFIHHTAFNTFDRENPTLCSKCERRLTEAIESFINGVIID